MESLSKFAATFSDWVWSGIPFPGKNWTLPWLVILLFGTHLFLTVRLGFIQRFVLRGIRLSFAKKGEGAGDVSQFGALATALAATVGTGNIVGVAGAILLGGPGAVLWMWLTGVFGIATKYGEALLSVKYRVQLPNGQMAGGPMYVLERGLNAKWLGVLFAAFTMFAAFGIGNMTQANSVAERLVGFFRPDQESMVRLVAGIVMMGLTAAVILGGVQSIARACTFLVPFMALFYIAGCLIYLGVFFDRIPGAIETILAAAFAPKAVGGGLAGAGIAAAMRYGIARGLFSNESGLGSAPIVAAAAQTRNPVRQALVSATGTFWDTVVICLLTGLVFVSSGHWQTEGIGKAGLASAAFGDLHAIGPVILTVALLTFVFSTILGWSYFGEKAAEYLFGNKIVLPYRLLWVAAVLAGAVMHSSPVWDLADGLNGLMAIPNLIALLALNGVIAAETKAHAAELRGKD